MDLDLKLKQGEEIIKVGNKFLEMLNEFHNNTKEERKQLEDLLKTDERFKDMEKRMKILGDKLGM
jgi:hypothetical protein